MDFVERWLHVSPDGGNGMYEIAVVLLLMLVAIGIWQLRGTRRAVRRARN